MTAERDQTKQKKVMSPGVESFEGWPSVLGSVTAGSDLSSAQAGAAMAQILAGEASDAQISGLIVGLRMKGESVEELLGFSEAMVAAAEPLALPKNTLDIVGTGGSQQRRAGALNVSTMACVAASAAGATVCKHGNRRASSTSGSFDFLEAIGIPIDITPSELEQKIADTGLGFAFARTFHPAMRFVGPTRAQLGIPTVFNVLGPLAHPGKVTRQIIGVTNRQLGERMAQVLLARKVDRAWVVMGHDGLDELSLTGPSEVFDVAGQEIVQITVDPSGLGLRLASSVDDLRGGDGKRNAAIFRAMIEGHERGPKFDIVALNAAAGLVVAGLADGLETALSKVVTAFDDGSVGRKLLGL